LLAQLAPQTRFIEPAAGQGHLVRHLQLAGHRCVGAFDLPTDARVAKYDVPPDVPFITNPPYFGQPAQLHPLIENLSDQGLTWLLLPLAMLANVGFAEIANERLRLVAPIGRLKWIEGTRYSGKDDYMWALFDYANEANVAHIVGRMPASGVPAVNRAAPALSLSPSAADLREVLAET
jgi:hypothetical protein